MFKTIRSALSAAVMASAATLLSGCVLLVAGAAAGAAGAGAMYAKGDLETTLQARPPRIVAASEKAFEEMNIARLSSASTELDGKVVGRTASDKKVTVTVKTEGEKLSKLSIRVGVFGDEALSRQILEKIKKEV
jgi:ABC-type Fe3+-hydroxamate transport system substrate-binding protein